MKKPHLLLMLVALLVSAIGMTSCKDDESDTPLISTSSSFVGIWLCDDDTWAFDLKADGTGKEYLSEGGHFNVESITWSYSEKESLLVIDDSCEFIIISVATNGFVGIESGGSKYGFTKRSNLSFLEDW